jgi:hypothetical protein
MSTATLEARSESTTEEQTTIPPGVIKIRVNAGPASGVWVRHMATMPAKPGTHWRSAEDLGRRLSPGQADAWFREGRVAILADVPIAEPQPVPPEDVPAETAGRCSLRLTINGTGYSIRPIDAGFAGVRAFRLRKADGKTYDVVQDLEDAIRCDCGDFIFRREGLTDRPCKHGAALVALGMLEDPAR